MRCARSELHWAAVLIYGGRHNKRGLALVVRGGAHPWSLVGLPVGQYARTQSRHPGWLLVLLAKQVPRVEHTRAGEALTHMAVGMRCVGPAVLLPVTCVQRHLLVQL